MKHISRHETFKDKIPFLKGRPDREFAISKDDTINLLIALEIHRDVTTFCADKHIFG
jgi:hypothetical protein